MNKMLLLLRCFVAVCVRWVFAIPGVTSQSRYSVSLGGVYQVLSKMKNFIHFLPDLTYWHSVQSELFLLASDCMLH